MDQVEWGVIEEHYYLLEFLLLGHSPHMNALRGGHDACASSWPVITDQADAGKVFLGGYQLYSLNYGPKKKKKKKEVSASFFCTGGAKVNTMNYTVSDAGSQFAVS